jgi:hypothetical protein
VAHQHATVSVIVLLVMVVSAINYALALDNDGHFARAVGILIATVGVTVVSWTQIEGPAGGL